MNDTSKVLLTAVVGAAAGIVAGLLLAPSSGEETREKLKSSLTDAKGEFNDLVNAATEKVKETINKGGGFAGSAMDTAKQAADTAADKVKA